MYTMDADGRAGAPGQAHAALAEQLRTVERQMCELAARHDQQHRETMLVLEAHERARGDMCAMLNRMCASLTYMNMNIQHLPTLIEQGVIAQLRAAVEQALLASAQPHAVRDDPDWVSTEHMDEADARHLAALARDNHTAPARGGHAAPARGGHADDDSAAAPEMARRARASGAQSMSSYVGASDSDVVSLA